MKARGEEGVVVTAGEASGGAGEVGAEVGEWRTDMRAGALLLVFAASAILTLEGSLRGDAGTVEGELGVAERVELVSGNKHTARCTLGVIGGRVAQVSVGNTVGETSHFAVDLACLGGADVEIKGGTVSIFSNAGVVIIAEVRSGPCADRSTNSEGDCGVMGDSIHIEHADILTRIVRIEAHRVSAISQVCDCCIETAACDARGSIDKADGGDLERESVASYVEQVIQYISTGDVEGACVSLETVEDGGVTQVGKDDVIRLTLSRGHCEEGGPESLAINGV